MTVCGAPTCAWRILKYARNRTSSSLVTMSHARPDDSPRSSHYHRFLHSPSRRCALCRCRVRSHETSTTDRESLAPSCTKSPRLGSADRGILFAMDQAETSLAIGNRIQTIDSVEFPSCLGQRKYRFLFSPKRRPKPGPKGLHPDLIRVV